MSFILQALNRLRPGVGVSVNAEDLDQIVWYGDVEAPSKEEIEDEILKIKEEEALVEYKKLRKLEYPSLEECIHAILDDNLEELQAKRKAVKEKYPKPELKDGN